MIEVSWLAPLGRHGAPGEALNDSVATARISVLVHAFHLHVLQIPSTERPIEASASHDIGVLRVDESLLDLVSVSHICCEHGLLGSDIELIYLAVFEDD